MSPAREASRPPAKPGPVALEGDDMFDLGWTADNHGVVVHVTRKDQLGMVHTFKGWTLKTAEGLARAFIEEERAKADRENWGKRRRRAGRKRQAALKEDIKGQSP